MSRLILAFAFIYLQTQLFAATFGTVTTVVGSLSDIVLDEGRRRLYLINGPQDRVDVYSLPPNPIRLVTSIRTDSLPLSAAMSRDGQFLYVAAHNASSLNVIDLERMAVVRREALPARPEGVAVGGDERVLITTIGTGFNAFQNTLLLYDPANNGELTSLVVTPPTPANPVLPPAGGRAFLTNRSRLEASADGSIIVGVNVPNNNSRAVFVYEVASSTVVRSRTVANVSEVLTLSPDGRKFMAGLTLFATDTLEVLAQQNLANAPYPIPPQTNFNTEQNQGGSVFSPDGSTIYSAFNVAPFQNPPARPNIGQLMVSDSDNLLIRTAYQMPENLAGKMVITRDGGTVYAISESGFTAIPIANANQFPIATISASSVLVANDQCGVTGEQRRALVQVNNSGRGRLTARAEVLQFPAGGQGLGGPGGPGGGIPGGGGIIIILPPVLPGGPQPPGGGGPFPGFGPGGGPQNAAIFQTAPQVRPMQGGDNPTFEVTFNPLNTRTMGTVSPTHDFLIQSPEAINIPPRLRVFQNNRDAEARANVIPIPIGVSNNERLEDIAFDPVRRRVYIANSGLNRIEVFDARENKFLDPIKVGQLPRSMALMPDGNTLYVANSNSESLSIVDLNENAVVGRVRMPPLPFNANVALITPSVIAATQRGPLVIMNNGTLWKVVGDELVPRPVSPIIGANVVQAPRSIAATPNGEYAMVLAGNGFVYLYDAVADDFVVGRQIFTNPIQGFYGPVSAGPGGRYFIANGTLLNSALTPIGSAGAVVLPVGPGGQNAAPRPIASVVAFNQNSYLRFAPPVVAGGNNPFAAAAPNVEMADANTGNTMRSVPAVEGPVSTQAGNQRVNVNGRTMAVDPQNGVAYILTASGLSIVNLDAVLPTDRPVLETQNGVVNLGNSRPAVAPGSLVAIKGRNLAETAKNDAPLPTVLGGTCVTLNNRPLPLLATSSGQINAQIPPDVAPGRYPLVVRNIDRKASSLIPMTLTVAKYAPAVMVNPETKQASIFHPDGKPVTKENPAKRDERLTMFAVGLGVTKGGRVTAGAPAPSEPPAITEPVTVFFGDPRFRQAEVVVEWSGLAPGLVGVYQVNLYVPGDRMRGDSLDVTLRIGGISSPTGGDLDPKVAVQ